MKFKALSKASSFIQAQGLKNPYNIFLASILNLQEEDIFLKIYLIQRDNCDSFKIAGDIDKEYEIAFKKARTSGIKILCYNCKLSNEEIILNKQIYND